MLLSQKWRVVESGAIWTWTHSQARLVTSRFCLQPSTSTSTSSQLIRLSSSLCVGKPSPNRISQHQHFSVPAPTTSFPRLSEVSVRVLNLRIRYSNPIHHPRRPHRRRPRHHLSTMSTLEELEDLDRRDRDDKKDKKDRKDDDKNGGKGDDGDADMKDAEPEEENVLDDEILSLSTQDILTRKRLLENDSRIMKSEYQRLSHEKATMAEKIKENMEKIANNR